MKILYLSTAGFPAEITHTLSMLRVCKALAEDGHEVTLTGRRLSDQSDQEILAYYGLKASFTLALAVVGKLINNRWTRLFELPGFVLAWRFRAVVRKFRPELIYSRLTLAELFAVPTATPLIYEMHSPGALSQNPWRRWLFKKLMQRLNVCKK